MSHHNKSFTEINWVEPVHAAGLLFAGHRLAFLDSAVAQGDIGRWSYLAVDPFGVFEVSGGIASWNNTIIEGSAIEALRLVFARYATQRPVEGPPFQGGAIGVIHYEAASLFDDVATTPGAPQIDLAFYDCVLAFDRAEHRLYVTGPAHEKFKWPDAKPQSGQAAEVQTWHDSRTRKAYETEVCSVVEAIRNGDIFQANLAHRFSGSTTHKPDAIATYKALRTANPAPFSALLVTGPNFIASTSPERFLRLDGRRIETRPIKGTIRRDANPAVDAERAAILKASEKDRAENIMIVDLLRNDLSRVAVASSVEVEQLCEIESYARLHHLVSIVSATLDDGFDWLDLLAATFPGGSITGAPKLKAMEIIASHEQAPRGVYCGAIGWIGFDGSMDLNIAIRTLTARGQELTLNAGGGITLLSDPAAEYDETLLKAEAVMSALASGGEVNIEQPEEPAAFKMIKAVAA
jgi:para-aminobenzoate synthetase component I